MDDMGTPSSRHPANKGVRNRANDTRRVIDLNVYRRSKEITGKGILAEPKELRSTRDPKDDISHSEKIHQATMIKEPKNE